MHEDLEPLCAAIDGLAGAVLSAWASDQTLGDNWGWNFPLLSRYDLATEASRLSADLRATGPDILDASMQARVAEYQRRVQHMQANIVQYLYNGNGHQAVPVYVSSLAAIRSALLPTVQWQALKDSKAMPAALARRLRYLQASIDQINPDQDRLRAQIKEIQEAHSVAESLPVDLQTLADSQRQVSRLTADSTSHAERAKANADTTAAELKRVQTLAETAEKLVAQCEEAFRITTTKGLSAAFDQRASSLTKSMWAWVVGLVTALAVGIFLGKDRVALVTAAMSTATVSWGAIGTHLLLSVAAVAGPIWFAWLATKQIGQRFRLAEDYAFKASVAKSYEGYRREAAHLDEAFSSRLFASALTRLDEAPLRLVEPAAHGSPWQEFFSSPSFQRALEAFPELKSDFLSMAKGLPQKVTGAVLKASDKESKTAPKE